MSFVLAGASIDNVVELFERYDFFDQTDKARVLAAVKSALDGAETTGSRKVRKALRHKLHWELNYGARREDGLPEHDISAVREALDFSHPENLIERHQWLFENFYCDLPEPEGRTSSKEALERLRSVRAAALQEVFDQQGFEGIEALDVAAGTNSCVGTALHYLTAPKVDILRWAAEKFTEGKLVGNKRIGSSRAS